jgi:hypothetical protein
MFIVGCIKEGRCIKHGVKYGYFKQLSVLPGQSSLQVSVYVCLCVYIYTYIERERERSISKAAWPVAWRHRPYLLFQGLPNKQKNTETKLFVGPSWGRNDVIVVVIYHTC